MDNYWYQKLGKLLMVVSALIVILGALAMLGGCSSQSGGVVSLKPDINYDRVMVVPGRVVESCEALPELTDGNKSGVLDWAINAHSNHGICMFRHDLSNDFLKAAAETQARVELFGVAPPANTAKGEPSGAATGQ